MALGFTFRSKATDPHLYQFTPEPANTAFTLYVQLVRVSPVVLGLVKAGFRT
jgi:hypothetical protein